MSAPDANGKQMKDRYNTLCRAFVTSVLCAFVFGLGSTSVRAAQAVPQQTPNPRPASSEAASKATATSAIVAPSGYVIGPDDVLTVIVWREKEMSGEAVVRPDGKISLPLINDIQAMGLTPDQLRATVTDAAKRFVEEPTVTVVVKQINSRKVFITGQVGKPGAYPLNGSTTVLQLIAMAGGVAEYCGCGKHRRDANRERGAAELPVQLRGCHQEKESEAEHRAHAGRYGGCAVGILWL